MPAPAPIPSLLVIDDDEGVLALLESALRREKWNVATVDSGAAGLAWLREHSADLLLIDLKLGDIAAREFISGLAGMGRSVPFIIITGQGDEREAVDMMKRGALDYLVKTVNFIELVPPVVRGALARLEKDKRLVEAEARQRESAERYRLLNKMAGTVVLLLGRGGEILEWGGEAERVYGRSPPQVVGQNYLNLFLAEADRPGVAAELEKVYAGTPTVGYENTVFARDGARPTYLWNAALLHDAGGSPIGALCVGHDITELKRLQQTLLEVSEREQRKFGHDLHDGLGQRLTGLEMMSHGLAEDLKEHAAHLSKQARRLNKELRETVTQARLISHSLAPVPLNGNGLMRGLTELGASTNRLPGVKCRVLCDPPVKVPDVNVATHLYRIAQEAVNNALKHGHAKRVDITLAERARLLELTIQNNGKPLPKALPTSDGLGLDVMRYRAGMIGATLAVESAPRKGVKVICTLRRTT